MKTKGLMIKSKGVWYIRANDVKDIFETIIGESEFESLPESKQLLVLDLLYELDSVDVTQEL